MNEERTWVRILLVMAVCAGVLAGTIWYVWTSIAEHEPATPTPPSARP